MATTAPALTVADFNPTEKRRRSRLDFALTTAALALATGTLFFGAGTLTAVSDEQRGEISELQQNTVAEKEAVHELERTNDLIGWGNAERSAIILELDTQLKSTEGFLQ